MTPRALRTRWAVARLSRIAGRDAVSGGRSATRVEGAVRAMGLDFPSAIGLAAGFDRRGRLVDSAHRLGIGAVEVGTLSVADGRPVLLRHPAGLVRRGVSIGKPVGVGWEGAADAFVRALRAFHAAADYVTLNPGRDCPSPAHFADVVAAVVRARNALARHRLRPLPLVAKLAGRWLLAGDAVRVAEGLAVAGVDGLLVSAEGMPSRQDALSCLARLSDAFGPRVCLISVGGVDSVAEMRARLNAGATLVQAHRALLTRDPQLLRALRGEPLRR